MSVIELELELDPGASPRCVFCGMGSTPNGVFYRWFAPMPLHAYLWEFFTDHEIGDTSPRELPGGGYEEPERVELVWKLLEVINYDPMQFGGDFHQVCALCANASQAAFYQRLIAHILTLEGYAYVVGDVTGVLHIDHEQAAEARWLRTFIGSELCIRNESRPVPLPASKV